MLVVRSEIMSAERALTQYRILLLFVTLVGCDDNGVFRRSDDSDSDSSLTSMTTTKYVGRGKGVHRQTPKCLTKIRHRDELDVSGTSMWVYDPWTSLQDELYNYVALDQLRQCSLYDEVALVGTLGDGCVGTTFQYQYGGTRPAITLTRRRDVTPHVQSCCSLFVQRPTMAG